jgi:phage recombination protein Bet
MSTEEKKGVSTLPAIVGLAKHYDLDAAAFVYTFKQVAMPTPHTDAEFVSCCLVAREHGLNPLTKEIYFMRDKHGRMQAIVGVDGWIKKCNEHPQYDGVVFHDTVGPDGKIACIRASIYRKDRTHPTEATEYLSECLQVRDKVGPWQSHPNRMLRHKALIQAARIAFGFAGVMDRDEFDQWHGMRDITPRVALASLPEVPDIPDLPDIPDTGPENQDAPDDLIADEAGFLDDFEESMDECGDDAELRLEVWQSNEHMRERISPAGWQRMLKRKPVMAEAAE